MPKPIKPVPFSVRLNKHDLYLLRKICAWDNRNAADEIRYLIKKEVAHLGLEKASNELGIEYTSEP